MQKMINELPLERFFDQALNQWHEFPLEMRLAEGSIMGGVALATIVFLAFGMVRKSAMGMIAGFFLFTTFMLEALSFGRLDFLPPNAYDLILATFFAATILFVTGSIRVAKDSITMGLILLAMIIGVFALGIADFLQILEAQALMQFAIGGLAVFTVLFVLINTFLEDRGAALILPGFILAASSLVALFWGMHNGVNNWIQAVLPNALLALGAVFAAFAALFSGHKAPRLTDCHVQAANSAVAFETQPNFSADDDVSQEPASEPTFSGPATVEVTNLEELDNPYFDEQETTAETENTQIEAPRSPLFEEHAVTTSQDVQDAPTAPQPSVDSCDEPHASNTMSHAPAEISQPHHMPTNESQKDPQHDALHGTPPNSSVWKTAADPCPTPSTHAHTVTTASANVRMWCWTAPSMVDVSTNAAPLFGATDKEALQPVMVRDCIAEHDLEAFDEHILGAGLSQNGFFDFVLHLRTGSRLRLRGSRSVDEHGLISRIIALVERVDVPCPTPGSVSARAVTMPAQQDGHDNMQSGTIAAQSDARLRKALENREIIVHFQPIVRLSDHEIIGFEALVRWHQPETGQILPASAFIHRIIDTGLELQLIENILDEAARELADWCAAEPAQGQFVTFNVSATEFVTSKLVTLVADKMRQYKLPTGSIIVEVTESHVEQNLDGMAVIAKQLKAAGAQLALDDFGSGYANFNRLSTIPFDIIKTDKSLTRRIVQDENARHVLELVIDLSRKLGMKTIIEGVENADMAQNVEAMQADWGQGYFYGLPEPADGSPTVMDTQPAKETPPAPKLPTPPPLSELR